MNYQECVLDMYDLFQDMSDLRYFATKINTPFFESQLQFPDFYPVGRDVDIITHPDDFSKVAEIVRQYCQKQNMSYRILFDSPSHERHRLESPEYFILPGAVPGDKLRNGQPLTKLHFQFDISSVLEKEYQGIDVSPLLKEMNSPIFSNGVKILSNKNEALLRCVFYSKSRSMHHRTFIYNNRDIVDTNLIQDEYVWDAVNPIFS